MSKRNKIMKHLAWFILAIFLIKNAEIHSSMSMIQWVQELGNSYAIRCDFPHNDLCQVAAKAELCSFKCRTTLCCTHFYWENDVCYLKSNTSITKAKAISINKPNTICGILTPGK